MKGWIVGTIAVIATAAITKVVITYLVGDDHQEVTDLESERRRSSLTENEEILQPIQETTTSGNISRLVMCSK